MSAASTIVESLLAESFVGWHASPNSFRRFNTDLEGAHFGTREQAENLRKPGKKAAKPYVLDIQNPLRVRDMGVWTLDGIATELLHQDVITQADYDAIRDEFLWTDERGFAKLKAVLAALGYDGFVYDNEQEGQGDSYVAFYAKQIKPYRMAESADDFDPKDYAMQPSVIYRHPIWDVATKELRQWLAAHGWPVISIHRRKRGALSMQARCNALHPDYVNADDLRYAIANFLDAKFKVGGRGSPFHVSAWPHGMERPGVMEIDIVKKEHGDPKRYGEGPHPYA